MKKIVTLLISLALSHSVFSKEIEEYDALDNKDLIYFIAEIKNTKNLEYAKLIDIFENVKIRKKIKKESKKENQAEFKLYSNQYIDRLVSESRILKGREFIKKNRQTLNEIERKYGVSKYIITAIIGVETNYGENMGNYRAIDSLTTMAFENNPKSKFYRTQLESYIVRCLDTNIECSSIKSSWAGAIGYGQFIPTSIDAYAVDFNNNGYIDLTTEVDDAIASIGNYLYKHGWKSDSNIVERAYVSNSQNIDQLVSNKLNLNTNNKDLIKNGISGISNLNIDSKLFKVENSNNTIEYYVGYKNFECLTRYNKSNLYALSIFELAKKIKG